MGHMVTRTNEARRSIHPDLFLSHSSRDKDFVRRLAEDLTFCQTDVWLDEWELGPGDSLHDVIGNALEKSRFVGVVLGDNFADSRWASDELKQALSRERRSDRTTVLPILAGKCEIPPFLEDKILIDFRVEYYFGLVRLAGVVHGISRLRIEEAIRERPPASIKHVIGALRYCGTNPAMILGEDDFKEVEKVGKLLGEDRVQFNPFEVLMSNGSPHIKNLMKKLLDISSEDEAMRRPTIEEIFRRPE